MSLYLVGGFPDAMLGGLALNLIIALLTFAASFAIGHVLALGRLSGHRWVRASAAGYVEVVRATPLLMVVFWMYFSLPLLGLRASPLVAALIALTIYASAYQAEIVRAGIAAVAAGEMDAARTLGLSYSSRLFALMLPQAYRKTLPCFASYFVSLFKDTSVLYVVGLVDLMQVGLIASERAPANMLQAYATVGCLFFVVCFSASLLAGYLERRLGMVGCDPCERFAHPGALPIATQRLGSTARQA